MRARSNSSRLNGCNVLNGGFPWRRWTRNRSITAKNGRSFNVNQDRTTVSRFITASSNGWSITVN